LNNPSDAFLLAAVSSSMFSDVTTTNGSSMIDDDDDDDDDNDYNDNRGDASYRDYMSTMKYNLDEYSIFQSPRTGDALITALLNNPIDHIIVSNDDDDDDNDDNDDDNNIYSITKNIDRSILNSIISRIVHKSDNNNHYISSIYAILELITPQYSFHPTLTCSSKGYCSLFTFIQREIRKVSDRKSSFLMKQIKYDENYKNMYDNNVFHNDDDDDDDDAMSNKVMSDKEQLLQLYIIRDNVWKHLKTSIKTYYNNNKDNNKDNGEDNNNNNHNNDNSSGYIKRSNDVLNGRVIDSFLRCYQFDMNGAKMIWSKEILPLLKALYQPIDGMDNYNSR
jgi:hypothetical protein